MDVGKCGKSGPYDLVAERTDADGIFVWIGVDYVGLLGGAWLRGRWLKEESFITFEVEHVGESVGLGKCWMGCGCYGDETVGWMRNGYLRDAMGTDYIFGKDEIGTS